jgi:hypothetical protein
MMGKIIEDINYEEIEKMELPKNLVKFDQPKTPLVGVLTNKSKNKVQHWPISSSFMQPEAIAQG